MAIPAKFMGVSLLFYKGLKNYFAAAAAFGAGLSSTDAPSKSLKFPSVTTLSPSESGPSISIKSFSL
jgi:hypothetical protein